MKLTNDRKNARVLSVYLRKELYEQAAIEAADNHVANLKDQGDRPESISAIVGLLLESRYKRILKNNTQ